MKYITKGGSANGKKFTNLLFLVLADNSDELKMQFEGIIANCLSNLNIEILNNITKQYIYRRLRNYIIF